MVNNPESRPLSIDETDMLDMDDVSTSIVFHLVMSANVSYASQEHASEEMRRVVMYVNTLNKTRTAEAEEG